ncbi:unnamed protein product [Rhizophagus irregularis]|nr:unnamed protein product [Rhizophagus irregularis]
MATHDFSIEYLANSLIVRLDRRNIFPPLHNNPELFLSSRTCIIYKKIAEISNSKKKRTSSNKSPMQSTSKKTSVQSTSNKASMQLLSNTTSIETSRPSLTLPSLNDSIFNFNLIGNDFLLNNQSNNEDNLVSYTNFNGQIHNSKH